MSRKTIVEDFLQKISDQLDIDAPLKDEQTNVHTLRIGIYTLKIGECSPGLYLWSRVADIPEGEKEDLYIHLMHANFLGQGTGGASIGIDQDEKSLTLSLAIPYEVKYETFKEHLEDFLNYVGYWRDQIEAFKKKVSIM